MRRAVTVLLLATLALAAPGELLARRAAGVLEYTTSVQKTYPAAANCINVTPNASSFVYSSWVEIIPVNTITVDFAITGIAYFQGTTGVEFSVAIGTGAAASETQVHELSGMVWNGAEQQVLEARVPLQITANSRVSLRMRKFGTNVSNWCYALTYLELPIAGLATSTAASGIMVFPSASLTPSGSSWGNSAYQTLEASTATARTIYSLTINNGVCNAVDYEFDIATGAAASETVKTTVKGRLHDNGGSICADTGTGFNLPIYPPLEVPAGVRTSIRFRKSGTQANQWHPRINQVNTGGLTRVSTALAQNWVPSAAAGTTVTAAGGSWAAGSWVQFIASTSTAVAITALTDTCTASEANILEIGVGAAPSEAVVGTYRTERCSSQGKITWAMRPAINVASGQRVTVRRRHHTGGSSGDVSLGYIENPDFDQRTDRVSKSLPASADGPTVTPPASSFGNSGWGVLTSSLTSDSLFTSLSFLGFGPPRQVELDLGVGAASSEAVVGTVRTYHHAFGGNSRLEFMVPVRILAGSRVVARFRGSGTNTTTGRIGAEYLDNYSPPAGGVPFIIGGRPPWAARPVGPVLQLPGR